MSDLGRWFKLWCASVYDPDLDNLPISDFGRWAKLGAIIKEQGTSGKITFTSPAKTICAAMQVDSFQSLFQSLQILPNVFVSSETSPCVSFSVEFRNWLKYQENLSTDRVRRFRQKKAQSETSKRRGEEKRGEEKRKKPPLLVSPPSNGMESWAPEWKPITDRITTLPFLEKHKAWLADLDWWKTLDELFTSCPVSLDILLTQAVAYCQSEGYVPRTKAAIRKKLKNCMEFSARRAEREAQAAKH